MISPSASRRCSHRRQRRPPRVRQLLQQLLPLQAGIGELTLPETTTPPADPSASAQPPAEQQPPAEEQSQVDCRAVFQGQYSDDPTRAIEESRTCRQDPQLTTLDAQTVSQALTAFTCPTVDPLIGNDDPALPLLTSDQDRTEKYVLAPVTPPTDGSVKDDDFSLYSRLTGEDIDNAVSGTDPQGAGFVVDLTFKGEGGDKWGKFTSANVSQQVAVVLDSQVVSAPNINEPILGGSTQISGKFSQAEATSLANVLKYGSLPLSFEASEAETVSASTGPSDAPDLVHDTGPWVQFGAQALADQHVAEALGRRVERRFGWDCHGLPAEYEAERQLGIAHKSEIEAMGVERASDELVRDGMNDVVYDDTQGLYAARVWWSLRAYGLEAVRLLDGGFPAWTEEGRPVWSSSDRSLRAPRYRVLAITISTRFGMAVSVWVSVWVRAGVSMFPSSARVSACATG